MTFRYFFRIILTYYYFCYIILQKEMIALGKITHRYDEYLPYMEYNGNSEDELYELLAEQTELLKKKGVDLTLSPSPKGLGAYTNEIYPGIITPYHRHDYYEANFVYEGRIMEYIEKRKITLSENDLLLMSPSVHHTSHPIGNARAQNIILSHKLAKKIQELLSRHNSENYLNYITSNNGYVIFHCDNSDIIRQAIDRITHINRNKWLYEPYTESCIENAAEWLFLALASAPITEHSYKKSQPSTPNSFTKETFSQYVLNRDDRIMWYISDHCGFVSLQELSAQFGYSVQQLRRIIKKRTGMTFSTYIQVIRLNRATDLLISSNLSINKIAQSLGIDSPEYFSRWFKREHNCTPSEYRQRHRKSVSSQKQ